MARPAELRHRHVVHLGVVVDLNHFLRASRSPQMGSNYVVAASTFPLRSPCCGAQPHDAKPCEATTAKHTEQLEHDFKSSGGRIDAHSA
jgi:hypothetical protein